MRYRAASWRSPMGRGVQAREIWVVMRRPELGNETADADQSVRWERCVVFQLACVSTWPWTLVG